MRTGSELEVVLTRSDGTVECDGPWVVPHDSNVKALDELAEEIGWAIVYEIARQDPLEVVRVEVREVAHGEE